MGVVLLVSLAGVLGAPRAALADSVGETHVGYVLVQQALGHLAHDASPGGIQVAMEKVDDALAAEDHEGVDLDAVQRGKAALEAGRVDEARTLLQGSIAAALKRQPPARGNETGTTLVLPELPGRGGLQGQDWGFLVASTIVLLLGLALAFRFRPRESVGQLRRRLGPPVTGGQVRPPDEEGRPR